MRPCGAPPARPVLARRQRASRRGHGCLISPGYCVTVSMEDCNAIIGCIVPCQGRHALAMMPPNTFHMLATVGKRHHPKDLSLSASEEGKLVEVYALQESKELN
ncbi:hypothetical protein Cni_G19991 [Canna indica]|uniref:Uncharacterized protein n=1 Tax=Canna indica TaxID=4628 RepID=A0AAQ3KMB4_9LILI|nr:hypothetical protein Cni_G19991 [Canna indica]